MYPRKPRKENENNAAEQPVFHFHQGVDIGGPVDNGTGTLISVVSGTVMEPTVQNGYGQTIHIADDTGRYWYKYAHCHTVSVQPGTRVEQRQPIGLIGRTDCNTRGGRPAGAIALPHYPPNVYDGGFGAHLHFEVLRRAPNTRLSETTLDATRFGTLPEVDGLDRVDPRHHLRQLGPWGGPKLYFPLVRGATDDEGYEVTEERATALFQETESTDRGGYFPLGANQTWHGGVHLAGEPGALVRAPFGGHVVAARLDPDPAHAFGAFGGTNFLLMIHDLPPDRLADFTNQRGDDDAHRGSVGVDQRGRRRPRLAANAPADVDEIRTLLTQAGYYHPEAADADAPAPAAAPAAGAAPAFEPALLDAIIRFQGTVMRRPEGIIDIPGRTYQRLKEAAGAAQRAAREAAGEHPNRIYSLFMHLSPQAFDDGLAARIPWLGRVASIPTEAERQREESERQARASAIRGEAAEMGTDREHRITSNVPGPVARTEEADIRWVQRRLTAHGFAIPEDGLQTPELSAAIRAFQTEHGRGRPDGVVSAPRPRQASGTTTFFLLRLTPTELAQPAAATEGPRIDARFADRAATRQNGVADVLVADDFSESGSIPVFAGEPIWVVGDVRGLAAGDRDAVVEGEARPHGIGTRHAEEAVAVAGIHWEVFTEDAIVSRFEQIDDDNDDRSIDSVALITRIRDAMRASPPTVGPYAPEEGEVEDPPATAVPLDGSRIMGRAEIARFYGSEGSRFLRRVQCRFHSEWALDANRVADSYAALGWNRALLPEMLAPYLWWSQAGSAVASSPLVWHMNPIAFLLLYWQQLPSPTVAVPAVAAPSVAPAPTGAADPDDASIEWCAPMMCVDPSP